MSSTVIAINCERRTKPAQGPGPQTVQAAAKTAPAQENQYLRPRVLRQWALRHTIWQIATRERRLPSEIERILWEELVSFLPPARAMRRAA